MSVEDPFVMVKIRKSTYDWLSEKKELIAQVTGKKASFNTVLQQLKEAVEENQ